MKHQLKLSNQTLMCC